jgi:hypothetical protein
MLVVAGSLMVAKVPDQAECVLDLPVGELVRAGAPVLDHAEPFLVGGGQAGERGVHPGQLRGPVISQGEQHAQE